MNNSQLINRIYQYKKIVIFGANDVGLYLCNMIQNDLHMSDYIICDNSRKKQGIWNDLRVFSVVDAVNENQDALFLLCSKVYQNIMSKQLINLGIEKNNILLAVTDEIELYIQERKNDQKRKVLTKIQFEVDITAHCNLNCKCCSQFSCIAEEEFIDIDTMERDFKRLGLLFDGICERIYLIGGEPLLHPNITTCMDIARKYFPYGKISVFSNGLLLLSMQDDFWKSCRNNDITIIVTKYPINLNYSEIEKKVTQEGVKFEFFATSEDFKYMSNLGLDLEGTQDICKSFANCGEANNCIKLSCGKLFTCTRPAAIYKFNKFFKQHLEVSDVDGIDIYEVNSGNEILEKLARPIPFCRYCDKTGKVKAMPWGQTKGDIEEWL